MKTFFKIFIANIAIVVTSSCGGNKPTETLTLDSTAIEQPKDGTVVDSTNIDSPAITAPDDTATSKTKESL